MPVYYDESPTFDHGKLCGFRFQFTSYAGLFIMFTFSYFRKILYLR